MSAHRRSRRTTSALALVVGVILLVPAAASANAPRVTQGDAQAVFNAFNTGGWAALLNGMGIDEGAPTDFTFDGNARISPLAQWAGRHFCSLDWHVVGVAAIEGNPAGGSRTNWEIRDFLARTTLVIRLDGVVLETERTAITRYLNPALRNLVEAFQVGEGRIMAPEELAIGQHTIQLIGQRPGSPVNVMAPITFHIDGPDEGACL